MSALLWSVWSILSQPSWLDASPETTRYLVMLLTDATDGCFITVQHVRKWCCEFADGRISILWMPKEWGGLQLQPPDWGLVYWMQEWGILQLLPWYLQTFIYSQSSKKYLEGQCSDSGDDIKETVTNWQCQQDRIFYYQGFDSLIFQYDKCLRKQGDHVEK